jgi:CheY-like chemotaxis protein
LSAEVLVVDDDAAIRRMLERTLAAEGYDVATAADAGNALAAIERTMPELRDLMTAMTSGYVLRAGDTERARVVCLAQRGIERVTLDDGAVRFSADEEAVAALSIALGQARIGITALMPERASLEELFLGLTGGESSDHDRAVA